VVNECECCGHRAWVLRSLNVSVVVIECVLESPSVGVVVTKRWWGGSSRVIVVVTERG